jgi:hypothetical protein
MGLVVHRLGSPEEPPDGSSRTPSRDGEFPGDDEDLPYKVEVWDETGEFVEQVVAISVSPTIGYAAYFAAAREYPGRAVTLRHRSAVISRWAGNTH